MADRLVNYYFGRVNLIAVYDSKLEFLLQGLQAGEIYQTRGSGWGFFEVEVIAFDQQLFITGYLVKYKAETEEEVVVHETQQIEEEAVSNRVIAKSRFFLHVPTGIIAYHPVSKQVRREQFASNFAHVFLENHARFFVSVEIESIGEERELLEALGRFDLLCCKDGRGSTAKARKESTSTMDVVD